MKKKAEKALADLISDYQETLDNLLCSQSDDNNDGTNTADDWRCKLSDCGNLLIGRSVTADADFNGSTRSISGTVALMQEEFVYINTSLGYVEAYANTMTDNE